MDGEKYKGIGATRRQLDRLKTEPGTKLDKGVSLTMVANQICMRRSARPPRFCGGGCGRSEVVVVVVEGPILSERDSRPRG